MSQHVTNDNRNVTNDNRNVTNVTAMSPMITDHFQRLLRRPQPSFPVGRDLNQVPAIHSKQIDHL